MHGLVERMRRDRRRLNAALELLVAFERMRRHAPAAAYLFARTLHEARAALLDEPGPREEKLALVEHEIAAAALDAAESASAGPASAEPAGPEPPAARLDVAAPNGRRPGGAAPNGTAPDAGLSFLALRLVRALLVAQGDRPGRELAGVGLIDGLVRDIASHGAGHHRALNERDRSPPDDEGVRAMLHAGGWSNVAEMAEATRGAPSARPATGGTVALALAMCDLRQEAGLGRLGPNLDALGVAIDGLR